MRPRSTRMRTASRDPDSADLAGGDAVARPERSREIGGMPVADEMRGLLHAAALPQLLAGQLQASLAQSREYRTVVHLLEFQAQAARAHAGHAGQILQPVVSRR